MLYEDQKFKPPFSTEANPHPEKLECSPVGFPLYNVVYKTAKKVVPHEFHGANATFKF